MMLSSVPRVSDVLCLMLVAASQKAGTKIFSVRHLDFQRIFKNSTNPLMKEVVFSNSGPESFSPALNDALNHLILSDLIGYPDIQHPEQMLVKPPAFEYVTRLSGLLFQAEKGRVDELADEFLSNIRP